MKQVNIEKSWFRLLQKEFEKDYFLDLKEFIRHEYMSKTVYPKASAIFNAFNSTPVDSVKVVIIGQDPYHGKGQADGLCFSVPENVKCPPSLVNIFKELNADVNKAVPISGNLQHWADQGVLLLNSTLTVVANNANSHKDSNWGVFTDRAIELLSNYKNNIVFLLWGNFAHKKEKLINKNNNHLILKTVHPSPLSAYNGFFGCKHFSKANDYLLKNGEDAVEW
ncbi:MAG: uracil-DNA glycosylase [Candidatus Marinimicrobia bacterium]|nr:uracil-DNA glycosylase [Candidatus Neomarinimicrobiota bacterium]